MAVESETIELKTISKFDPEGIDAAIAKYERLEMLHAKLSSLKIKVEPIGFTELNRDLTQIQGAVARISAMRGFDQLNQQITQHSQKLREAKDAHAAAHSAFVNTDYFATSPTIPVAERRQGAAKKALDEQLAAIGRQEAEMERLVQLRETLLKAVPPEQIVQHAQGAGKLEAAAAAKTADGSATSMSEAARKMAKAEAKLAAPAQAATAALEKQEAISRKKAAATKEAAGAVKQLSEAEKGVGQDAEKAAASMAKASDEAGRLYVKTNAEGEPIEEKFQVGPSDTMIRRGEQAITTHRDLAEATEQAAEAERKWRVQMAAAGTDLRQRLKFSQDYVESLRAQRAALGQAYEGSPEVKSIDTKLSRGEAAVAAAQAKIQALEKATIEKVEQERMAALQRVQRIEEQQQSRQAAARQRETERQTQQELSEMQKREAAAEKLAEKQAAHQMEMAKAAALKQGITLNPDAQEVRRTKVYTSGEGHTEEVVYRQTTGAIGEQITMLEKYNEAQEHVGTRVAMVEKQVKDLGRTGDWSARSFLHNTFVVGAWAASVGTFYAAINTVRSGAEAAVDIERKFGTLETVFHSSREEALLLRDSVLELAAAEGRSTDEAMDAATRFSRLGLSRIEVIEATTAALKASNIAQISTAESAEYLSAIMVGYGLHAKDLSVILNQLNAMAVSYNVTNKEMLDGISRVSSLAQRAKLPLVELAGLIAAGVGATGRPGAEFGNAIKAVITSINTPSKQKKMDEDYGIEVKTGNDDLKDMSTILAELYVRYQQLTGAQQASLLQVIGQRQQGARLAAMLDNYVASQVLAIRAQTDLNSAERENMNIRATMSSQLQTLQSEFQRMSVNLVASGQNISVSNGIQEVLKLLSNGLKVLADHPTVLSVIIGLLTMMAAKMALLAVSMAATDQKGNFFLNTIKQITLAVRTMGEAMEKSNADIAAQGGYFAVAGEKAEAAAGGMIASLGGLKSLWGILKNIGTFLVGTLVDFIEFIPYVAIFAAGIWGINKAFDYFRGSAEKATDAAAGLNDQIERANNLGGAAAQSARLLATIEKAAPDLDDKGFRKAAHGVAEIAFPGLDDDRKRQALEDELEKMREQGRYDEIQAKLEGMRVGYLADANNYRRDALNLTRQQLAAEQQRVQAIQTEIEAKNKAGEPADEERQQLREAQDRINTLTQKGMQDVADETDEATEEAGETPISKLMDSWMKGVQKGLDDFSSKIATDGTASDKLREEIQLLEAKKDALDDNAAAARKEYDLAEAAAQGRIAAAKKALEAAHDARIENARAELDSHAYNNVRWQWIGGRNRHNGGRLELSVQPNQASKDLVDFDKANAGYYQTIKDNKAAVDDATNAEVEATKALKDKRDALDGANKKAQEALDIARKEEDAQMAYARAQDAADDAARAARNIGLAGKYGRNEGEKIWNEAQAAYESMMGANRPATRNDGSQAALLSQVEMEAAVREKMKMLRDSELAAAQRQAELEAEIRQEMLKQNEEASKALLMGTRQEQMQATMIARFLQRRGGQGFSTNEFMFLDQDTREAIAKFFPSAAPTGAGTDMDKLLQERAELPEIRRRLAEERAAAESTFGGVDPTGTAARYAGLDKLQQPAVPEIALNVGGVHVDIGDQFAQLTTRFQNVVAQQLQPQLNKMSDRIAALERANAVTNAGARS